LVLTLKLYTIQLGNEMKFIFIVRFNHKFIFIVRFNHKFIFIVRFNHKLLITLPLYVVILSEDRTRRCCDYYLLLSSVVLLDERTLQTSTMFLQMISTRYATGAVDV
jgi:hypothetical protein